MTGICGWFLADGNVFQFLRGCCRVENFRGVHAQIEEQLLMFVLASLAVFLLIRPLAFLGNFLKNLKTGDFPAKTKKKVGGHGAEAGYK